MKILAIGIALTSALALGTNAWIDRIVDSTAFDIYLAADKSQAGEPASATKLRAEVMKNWRELGVLPESSHSKGEQSGDGVFKTELKPGIVEPGTVVVDRSNKSDREGTRVDGFSFKCKQDVCLNDPIKFNVVPFDSPRAIRGSFD